MPSEVHEISDVNIISVVTEEENETPKENAPTQEKPQNYPKSASGTTSKKKPNSNNILGAYFLNLYCYKSFHI